MTGTYPEVSVNEKSPIEDADFSLTGYICTLSLISCRYKSVILYCLMEYNIVRFNEITAALKKAAGKALRRSLKELEAYGLIHRKVYPRIPPGVEYTLTERGRSPVKVPDGLCERGEQNRS